VVGLGDDERVADADDPNRLPEDRLDASRVAVASDAARLRRGLDSRERDDAAFGLGHDLLRHDDDVAVFEIAAGGRRDRGAEVVPRPNLGDALEREDPELGQGKPVTTMPAWPP
jgi:hypothetical protein